VSEDCLVHRSGDPCNQVSEGFRVPHQQLGSYLGWPDLESGE
jgi:hypothetical protein